jgi:hypothetical protein
VALFVVVGLWSFRALLFDGNFHTVIPNEVYRSAKPSPEALERRIKEFNLRSVIWLSTRKDKDPWVKAERSVTEVHGVNFYLVRLGNFIPPQPHYSNWCTFLILPNALYSFTVQQASSAVALLQQ